MGDDVPDYPPAPDDDPVVAIIDSIVYAARRLRRRADGGDQVPSQPVKVDAIEIEDAAEELRSLLRPPPRG